MKLYFPEITFSAAHYISGHVTCGGIHGHTYFIRDLTIEVPDDGLDEVGMSVDFGKIKEYFKSQWDHKFLIPERDIEYWTHIYEHTSWVPVSDNRKVIKYTTAEGMAKQIQSELIEILANNYRDILVSYVVHFVLFEGPGQGIKA